MGSRWGTPLDHLAEVHSVMVRTTLRITTPSFPPVSHFTSCARADRPTTPAEVHSVMVRTTLRSGPPRLSPVSIFTKLRIRAKCTPKTVKLHHRHLSSVFECPKVARAHRSAEVHSVMVHDHPKWVT